MDKEVSNNREDTASPYWARTDSLVGETLGNLPDAIVHDIGSQEVLQLAGDKTNGIFFVLRGWLVVSKYTQDGKRQIIDFLLPGEVFDPGSASNLLASTELAALTDATVSIIARASWDRALLQHSQLRKTLDRRMAAGFSRIAERLLRVGKSDAEARIAYAICELCLRSTDAGLVDSKGFHVPLTQQALGDFVGLSSVHVSRTLRQLRKKKVLGTGDHLDIVILDMDRLAEIAEVDLDELRAEIIPAG